MKARGFTLVEVMIAVAVLGILLAIAWPPFRAVQARSAVRSAADVFVLRHSMARSTALRRGRVAELHIDAAGGRLWVEVDTAAIGTGVKDTVGRVVDVALEFAVSATSTRNLLCFDARGLATQVSGCPPGDVKVVFERQGYTDSVTTTVLGKVLR